MTPTPTETQTPAPKKIKWGSVFSFLLANFVQITQGVIAVDAALHGAPGATKKQTLMNVVQIAANVGEALPEPHIQAVSQMIDKTVADLKAAGIIGNAPKPAEV